MKDWKILRCHREHSGSYYEMPSLVNHGRQSGQGSHAVSKVFKKYWISKLFFKTFKKYGICPKCKYGILAKMYWKSLEILNGKVINIWAELY